MDILEKIDNKLNEQKDDVKNVVDKTMKFIKKNSKKGDIQVLRAVTPTKIIIFDPETDTEVVFTGELNR